MFLMTFWKPIAIIVLVAVIAGAAAWWKHSYDERRRDEGRLEVQLAWDEAIEAQKVADRKNAEETRTRLAAQEADRAKQFAALRNRNRALESQLAAVRVDTALIAGMRDSVRTANAAGAGSPPNDAAPATGAPDGNQVNNWFADVAELYRRCRDQVGAWVEWDNRRVPQ